MDGEAGREFDAVKGLMFSRDGKHLAYVVRNAGKELVVVDGQEGAAYDAMGPGTWY